jgi:N-formylglutamate deformylase
MEFLRGVYWYEPPHGTPAPVVFDVPRSGREYPEDFQTSAPFANVHFLTSMYVEELWGLAPQAGCGLLYATFNNNWIDANRAVNDIDPSLLADAWPTPLNPSDKSLRLGNGLIHSKVREDLPLQPRKLTVADVQHRIDKYWVPYHSRLGSLMGDAREQFGIAYHMSCHCMGTIGPATSHDYGRRRQEFCLGDRDGQTCDPEILDVLAAEMRRLGYGVTFNDPFKGAESINMHADKGQGIHSVQIEMIKGMYMDEDTFQKKPDFDRIRSDLGTIAKAVADWALSKVAP